MNKRQHFRIRSVTFCRKPSGPKGFPLRRRRAVSISIFGCEENGPHRGGGAGVTEVFAGGAGIAGGRTARARALRPFTDRMACQPARARPGAKRGKRSLGPCVKDAKQPRRHQQMRRSANGRYAVSRTRQRGGNSNWHRFR